MKKILILCFVFLAFLGLNGCVFYLPQPPVNNPIKEGPTNGLPIVEEPDITEEPDEKSVQGIVYQNKKMGFELTLPKNWSGWYIVHEGEDFIAVSFYGKSETATVRYSEDGEGWPGLLMFFIGNETFIDDSFLDSIEEIGKVGTTKFYYATPTDYPVGSLFDVELFADDASEIALAKADYKRAKQMEDDVEDILKTFKAIK
jgi:hypothetical protein